MAPVRRMILALAAYLVGLVLLFGAAFVFLTGLADPDRGDADGPVVEGRAPYRPPIAFGEAP